MREAHFVGVLSGPGLSPPPVKPALIDILPLDHPRNIMGLTFAPYVNNAQNSVKTLDTNRNRLLLLLMSIFEICAFQTVENGDSIAKSIP